MGKGELDNPTDAAWRVPDQAGPRLLRVGVASMIPLSGSTASEKSAEQLRAPRVAWWRLFHNQSAIDEGAWETLDIVGSGDVDQVSRVESKIIVHLFQAFAFSGSHNVNNGS